MLARRLVAEFLGTAGLLAVIIGAGIMAVNLSGGNDGVALIGTTAAIGAGLVVLIWLFAPVSGCHINPAVTLAFLLRKEISGRDAGLYVVVQAAGGLAGMLVTHLMFDLPLLQTATQVRTGTGAVGLRGGGHLRPDPDHLRLHQGPPAGGGGRGGDLHLRGLLVHRLDLVRESGGDPRPELHGHLLRDPARGRPDVRADGDRGRAHRDAVRGLALGRRPPVGIVRRRRAKHVTPCSATHGSTSAGNAHRETGRLS